MHIKYIVYVTHESLICSKFVLPILSKKIGYAIWPLQFKIVIDSYFDVFISNL